jgi:hypothetical protein
MTGSESIRTDERRTMKDARGWIFLPLARQAARRGFEHTGRTKLHGEQCAIIVPEEKGLTRRLGKVAKV